MREACEEGSASDSFQVLPWGNSLLIRPTCTVGLPVSCKQQDKSSFSSDMFWRAAMSPGGTGRWGGKGRPIRTAKKVPRSRRVALRQHQFAALPLVPCEYTAFLYLPR